MSKPEQRPRLRLPVPVLAAFVALWAALLITCVVKERWIGVSANGLLFAASVFSLRQALRRRQDP